MMTILQRKTLLQFLLVVATSCSALLQSPPHRLGFRTMRMSTAVATSTGRMLTVQDVAANGRTFANMGMPRVILNKENNEWMLWIHARDENFSTDVVNLSTGRILHATSPDGLTQWKLHEDSPVLNPNKENGGDWFFFDSEHVGLGDVIQPGDSAQSKFAINDGNIFLMYIFGGCSDVIKMDGPNGVSKELKGVKMEIGVAVSQDGSHWSRIEGSEPYGSILVGGKSEDDYDNQFVGWPTVMEVGSEYRMYYTTFNPKVGEFQICLATAKDGLIKWNKRGPIILPGRNDDSFDGKGASRRHIIRLDDGSYRMWYEGVSKAGEHSIGCAKSGDGLVWERYSDKPIFSASTDPDAWDNGGVGSPHLVYLPEKKRWRMYYAGNRKTAQGTLPSASIGVAESVDEDGLIFERMTLEK